MSKTLDVLKWGISLGKQPQSFLSAKWIQAFLNRVPESRKPIWALRILSLSPHYFIDPDNPEYRGMNQDEYFRTAFEVLVKSREYIYARLLAPRLEHDIELLDYGCGPGFLAKAASQDVKKIYALDISAGAIACAQILNYAENIQYIVADPFGIQSIPDGKIDAIYSYAVIQHLTNNVFETVLDNCWVKLKPSGRLFLHIQLTDDVWSTERAQKSDRSIKGKIKYQYGLHCFSRSEDEHVEIVSRHNFTDVRVERLENVFPEYSDTIRSQRLLTARKVT